MSEQQRPSVGRIVHYRAHQGADAVAAVITRVNADGLTVELSGLVPGYTAVQCHSWVEHESQVSSDAAERWSWPERV